MVNVNNIDGIASKLLKRVENSEKREIREEMDKQQEIVEDISNENETKVEEYNDAVMSNGEDELVDGESLRDRIGIQYFADNSRYTFNNASEYMASISKVQLFDNLKLVVNSILNGKIRNISVYNILVNINAVQKKVPNKQNYIHFINRFENGNYGTHIQQQQFYHFEYRNIIHLALQVQPKLQVLEISI